MRRALPPPGQCHRVPPCLCSGIFSLNSLGRGVISCISLLPWLGRCFEVQYLRVYRCVCRCQCVSVCCVLYIWVWQELLHFGRQENNTLAFSALPRVSVCLPLLFPLNLFFFLPVLFFRLGCCHSARVDVDQLLLALQGSPLLKLLKDKMTRQVKRDKKNKTKTKL